jgi:N-acetylglucosaminyl-diphospho-decaprenol L-rhamnosyltransferase
VVSPGGLHEDSWRHFPTLTSLLRKALGMGDGSYRLPGDGRHFSPEWVAGMFMLFRSDVFRRLGGFDEDFFLYYEDVDICARLWKSGYRLLACPAVSVVHDAQRDSHRKWRHLRWHLGSMARYFAKHWGRLPRCAGDFQ